MINILNCKPCAQKGGCIKPLRCPSPTTWFLLLTNINLYQRLGLSFNSLLFVFDATYYYLPFDNGLVWLSYYTVHVTRNVPSFSRMPFTHYTLPHHRSLLSYDEAHDLRNHARYSLLLTYLYIRETNTLQACLFKFLIRDTTKYVRIFCHVFRWGAQELRQLLMLPL